MVQFQKVSEGISSGLTIRVRTGAAGGPPVAWNATYTVSSRADIAETGANHGWRCQSSVILKRGGRNRPPLFVCRLPENNFRRTRPLCFYAKNREAREMDIPAAIILSAFFAVVGVLLSNWQLHRSSRRAHTFNVFDGYRRDPEYLTALRHTKSIIGSGLWPEPDDSSREHDIAQLDFFLNHYEFIASAILNGDVDEQFIKGVQYTVIIRAYARNQSYIQKNVKYTDQPGLWTSLEVLYFRWVANKDLTWWNRVWQFLFLRPYLDRQEIKKLQLKHGEDPRASETKRSRQ